MTTFINIMDWIESLFITFLGACGGIVRAILSKEGIINTGVFIAEAFVGAFVGFIVGVLLSQNQFEPESIYVSCAMAGLMARDLLHAIIRKARKEIKQSFKE